MSKNDEDIQLQQLAEAQKTNQYIVCFKDGKEVYICAHHAETIGRDVVFYNVALNVTFAADDGIPFAEWARYCLDNIAGYRMVYL